MYKCFQKSYPTLEIASLRLFPSRTADDIFQISVIIWLDWASVAEWLERRFNPSAEGRRAGSNPVVALVDVCLSFVLLKISRVAILYMVMFSVSWSYVVPCGA